MQIPMDNIGSPTWSNDYAYLAGIRAIQELLMDHLGLGPLLIIWINLNPSMDEFPKKPMGDWRQSKTIYVISSHGLQIESPSFLLHMVNHAPPLL